ncbi:EpsG family protein [Vibrio furnissii]|uniref:EpsG family protein n=1 Tax=Vibrio furnissii TaxID=29494 RepID=UPI001EEC4917|nr:EpsG family protein [Vibrio furnissii]
MLYYFPLIILIFGSILELFFDKKNNPELQSAFVLTSSILLFLLLGFKGNIDPDYDNYRYIFDISPSLYDINSQEFDRAIELSANIEPGIILLNSILKFFGLGYQSFILLNAVLLIILAINLARLIDVKNICTVLLCVFALYYQGMFVQVRFALCLFLIFNAVFYLWKRDVLKSVLLLLASSLIHNVYLLSVVFALCFMFRELVVRRYILFLMFAIVFSRFNFNEIFLNILGTGFDRYNAYVLSYGELGHHVSSGAFPFYWRLMFFLVAIFIIFRKFNLIDYNIEDKYKFLFVCVVVNILSWSVGYNTPILYRVSWFFDIGYTVIPLLACRYSSRQQKLALILIFFPYLLYRVSNGLVSLDNFYFDWV